MTSSAQCTACLNRNFWQSCDVIKAPSVQPAFATFSGVRTLIQLDFGGIILPRHPRLNVLIHLSFVRQQDLPSDVVEAPQSLDVEHGKGIDWLLHAQVHHPVVASRGPDSAFVQVGRVQGGLTLHPDGVLHEGKVIQIT